MLLTAEIGGRRGAAGALLLPKTYRNGVPPCSGSSNPEYERLSWYTV